uniref:GRF-type domain-containing protein n=1 Tax=Oryza rufipogon TaxID=4529 RepID=A0A0E0PI54_ORYRU
MDGGYTASVSSWRMGKPALPLIQCPQCELKTIVRRKAKTSENYGRIFYTCPSHQRNGTGCDFWYWEEYYEQYLIKRGYLQACSRSRGKRQVIDLHGEGEGEGEGVGGRQVAEQIEDKQLVKKMNVLIEIGSEIVLLLQCFVACCLTESQKNELTESHHNSEITTGDRTYITR